jgi:hypothetical protein
MYPFLGHSEPTDVAVQVQRARRWRLLSYSQVFQTFTLTSVVTDGTLQLQLLSSAS